MNTYRIDIEGRCHVLHREDASIEPLCLDAMPWRDGEVMPGRVPCRECGRRRAIVTPRSVLL